MKTAMDRLNKRGAVVAAISVVLLITLAIVLGNGWAHASSRADSLSARAHDQAGQITDLNQQLDIQTQIADSARSTAEDVQRQQDQLKKDQAAVAKREAAVASAEKAQKANSFDNGTFVVGMDIQPGTYRTSGGDGCYWARLSDLSGSTDSIVANDNVSGQTTVTIAATDKGFESDRCDTWTKVG